MKTKILIVDDHEVSAEILMWAMLAVGYQVKIAFSSRAAIEVLDFYTRRT